MMKTKKVLAGLLSAALAMSFSVGAFAAEDAAKAYEAVLEKSNSTDSVDASMMMTMTLSKDGKSETVKMQTVTKAVNNQSSDMRVYVKMYLLEGTENASTTNVVQSIYYKDGYCYVEGGGKQVKYAMPLKEIEEQLKSSNTMKDMDGVFTDIRSARQGTDTVFTLEADEAKMTEAYAKIFDALGSMSNMQELKNVQIDVNSLKATVVANQEGYMTSMNLKMSLDMTMSGETYRADYDINMVNHNPGQPVSIDFPDFTGFQDVTGTMQKAA